MNKFLIIGIIVLGIFLLGVFGHPIILDKMGVNQMDEKNTEKLYQGPVPEGYDLEHFRKTGITQKLEVEE